MQFDIYRAKQDELINGCLRRDNSAQRLLYETYSPRMYGLCCRYVKDAMDAEDVLVGAFTKIFDKIHQFKNEGSFEGWIRKIVVNEALTYLRRHRSMYLEIDLEQAVYEPDYQSLGDRLEADDLLSIIQTLPTGYRIVFNLYAIDGYTHKEIADQLGISENTSKSQLSRARAYLQKILAEQECMTNKKISSDESTT